MRQRTVSDYFWRDPKLCSLSQEDKATLLFFLTSPSSNIIGVYQVVWAIAGAEMGWTKDQLLVVVQRLRDRGLIDFQDDGWIFVKIWWEHNSASGAFSPKLIKNARRQCEAMPSAWLEEFLSLVDTLKLPELNRVSIGYPYPTDTPPPNTTTTTGISSSKTTTTSPLVVPDCGARPFQLIYPRLSPDEHKSIEQLVTNVPLEVRQPVLDELAGAINDKCITKGVVRYMTGLVKAVGQGTFIPALGPTILNARKTSAAVRSQHELNDSHFEVCPDAQKIGEEKIAAVRNRGANKDHAPPC